MKKNKLLFTDNEWTFAKLDKTWKVIEDIAKNRYGLSYYEPQFEVVDYETMSLNCNVTMGLPISYSHWSFGRNYLRGIEDYKKGHTGLAYELIINSDPAIVYLMETNTMAMQALVLAHAAVGHSSFFKNNYLYKEGISAQYIIPFLQYAKEYVAKCEVKYGATNVEELLDMSHALMFNSIDVVARKRQPKTADRKRKYNDQLDKEYNELYRYFDSKQIVTYEEEDETELELPERNLLYFIEKNSLVLAKWEKEILRIVRILAQYFYPQILEKMMNEGYASFWHYTIMNDLYSEGYISEGHMFEILHSHANVCNHKDGVVGFSLNPYKLGYSMFKDIKRMSLTPNNNDYELFPEIAGTLDWVKNIEYAMRNFNDSSFVMQYLSPTLIKDLKLYQMSFNRKLFEDISEFKVDNIQSPFDFEKLRKRLASSYELYYNKPLISIDAFDKTNAILDISYDNFNNRSMCEEDKSELIVYIQLLMGCTAVFEERGVR